MSSKTHKIMIGDVCNNACFFCSASSKKCLSESENILKEIRIGRVHNYDSVLFTGFEPTIHLDILVLLSSARAAGYANIAIDSNARMFCYLKFAEAASNAGLGEARILVPHHTPEGYEKITGVGKGFEQMAAGIKNLFKLKSVRLSARIPVCETNQRNLLAIIIFCMEMGFRDISLFSPAEGFFERDAIEADVIGQQIEKAKDCASEYGCNLDCSGIDRLICRDTELMEQSANSFYPQYYVGRRQLPEKLEAVLRPTFACNQICRFCWVNTADDKHGVHDMKKEISYIIRKRIPKVGISGGEPTLDPKLSNYVAMAKDGGVRQVELHTNAIKFSNPSLCRDIRNAGLDIAYCTLLAPSAAVSDSITRTDGTFRKTVSGILNLMTHSVRAVAHIVIMSDNYRLLPDFVRFVDSTFSFGDVRLPISFSFVAPRDLKAVSEGVTPRFTDVIPYLREAISMCVSLGIPFCAGEGLKGIPRCAMPFHDRYMRQIQPPVANLAGDAFVKNEGCRKCVYNPSCFGVRRHYAEYYGLDELRPVTKLEKSVSSLEKQPGKLCDNNFNWGGVHEPS